MTTLLRQYLSWTSWQVSLRQRKYLKKWSITFKEQTKQVTLQWCWPMCRTRVWCSLMTTHSTVWWCLTVLWDSREVWTLQKTSTKVCLFLLKKRRTSGKLSQQSTLMLKWRSSRASTRFTKPVTTTSKISSSQFDTHFVTQIQCTQLVTLTKKKTRVRKQMFQCSLKVSSDSTREWQCTDIVYIKWHKMTFKVQDVQRHYTKVSKRLKKFDSFTKTLKDKVKPLHVTSCLRPLLQKWDT